ncbi:GDSL esterase/lipase At2g40250-like [Telopea speciosissima]|uniref:GDSL esterase/lipase At2g40250-like n=1 Tax=Telopea speciosissima TaxID=54955 RepID=UPI001CC82E85|nr:GDSL esterase/lipase At2g40250-like [Telopea speciosissima]
MEKGRAIIFYFFLIFTLLVSSFSLLVVSDQEANNHKITAVFAFGDSTLDPGNNDGLTTLMHADHLPYGRDFQGGIATGRFTNGKLVTDMILCLCRFRIGQHDCRYKFCYQNNHNITAVFAFGDSTLDPGNNDRLTTSMRSDHPPYGRDFQGGIATGRFTNGKLVTDMIVSSLGIKDSVPAYLDPKITNHDLLTGVSFASAGSGLDDMTANIGSVMHMSTQLADFQKCLTQIQATVGNATAADIIQNAIFTVGASTNNMLFNYYDIPTRRAEYSLSGYQDFLLRNLETFVKVLNELLSLTSEISNVLLQIAALW